MGKGGNNASEGEILSVQNNNNGSPRSVINNDELVKRSSNTTTVKNNDRPWYIRGGFHVNQVGMAFNVCVPPAILLLWTATSVETSSVYYTPMQLFFAAVFVQIAFAAAEKMKTVYCIAVVPIYLASMIAIPGTLSSSIVPLVLAFIVAIWRGGICMSVCLHRYAAHGAFKCGPGMRLILHVLGSAAHQGGPIWWASQHRCHHKYCDVPRDPHSAIIDGVEMAFAFFSTGHEKVEEEFVPNWLDTTFLRLLDTFSFAVCSLEMYLAYYFFGREGLFISYTSQWLCQTSTLWFNIMNHPPGINPDKTCQATNGKGSLNSWYPGFMFLDTICPYYSVIVCEDAHDNHHVHFNLAKREQYDCMYYSFVYPLEKLGLIWDVKTGNHSN